jgi:multiple sugar transport system permease protein
MASAAQKRIKSISYAKYGYMFIAPFFIVYCFFQVWPLINTFILAFYGNGNTQTDFVGFQNFSDILTGGGTFTGLAQHQKFGAALVTTIILWFGNFIPQILLSLLLAVWFTDAKLKIRGKGFFKVVMYLPNIITAASVAALFLSLFGDSKYGAVNSLLMGAGLISSPIKFVTNTAWARGLTMFIQTWLWFGNTMIMLMSGIMGINPSLFEAADIDGASSWKIFTNVTLPLLQPIMVYTLITSMIGGLQMFDIPYLFHETSSVTDSLRTVAVYVYENFHTAPSQANYGYSAAASVILFAITAVLGSFCFYMNRDMDEVKRKKKNKEARKALKMKQKEGLI